MLRSPVAALILFLIGLGVLLFVLMSRDSQQRQSSDASPVRPAKPQPVAHSVEREVTPFKPVSPKEARQTPLVSVPQTNAAPKPELPSLSLVVETSAPVPSEKEIGSRFAPFGRLIKCELVITVDSSAIATPIVGLVTEDVFHHGELIIPAGTEVHGRAQVERARERIASDGRWTLVWQTGEELSVSGIALDHESESLSETDGSAGLRGRLIKSDNLAELKLYAASLISGAADVFTDKTISGFGSFATPSLSNAPLKGAQSVLDRYAQQILTAIERDGFYVRVPAGKQFYLYITQTLDRDNARIGGGTAKAN